MWSTGVRRRLVASRPSVFRRAASEGRARCSATSWLMRPSRGSTTGEVLAPSTDHLHPTLFCNTNAYHICNLFRDKTSWLDVHRARAPGSCRATVDAAALARYQVER